MSTSLRPSSTSSTHSEKGGSSSGLRDDISPKKMEDIQNALLHYYERQISPVNDINHSIDVKWKEFKSSFEKKSSRYKGSLVISGAFAEFVATTDSNVDILLLIEAPVQSKVWHSEEYYTLQTDVDFPREQLKDCMDSSTDWLNPKKFQQFLHAEIAKNVEELTANDSAHKEVFQLEPLIGDGEKKKLGTPIKLAITNQGTTQTFSFTASIMDSASKLFIARTFYETPSDKMKRLTFRNTDWSWQNVVLDQMIVGFRSLDSEKKMVWRILSKIHSSQPDFAILPLYFLKNEFLRFVKKDRPSSAAAVSSPLAADVLAFIEDLYVACKSKDMKSFSNESINLLQYYPSKKLKIVNSILVKLHDDPNFLLEILGLSV